MNFSISIHFTRNGTASGFASGTTYQSFFDSLDGNLVEARRRLEEGFDVNWPGNYDMYPPLHRAAATGNLPGVQLLLEYRADVSLKECDRQWTALHCALAEASDHQYNIVKLLLESGASANDRARNGTTPFHVALGHNRMECAQLMLDHGADITAVDNKGSTALHYAAARGDAELTQFVLELGIDIESSDDNDYSVLQCAVGHGTPEICEFLLKRGAMVNRKSSKTGHTPMSLALSHSEYANRQPEFALQVVQILHVLLDHGAQVADEFQGKSILEITTAEDGCELFSNALMQHMAKIKCLNLKVAKQCDLRVIENKDCYKEQFQKCLQEIEVMKETKFYNNLPISILCNSDNVISGYARNEELVKVLDNEDYVSRFPIYFTLLKNRFDAKVLEQKLRGPAAKILRNIFKFNDPFHPVNQAILSFLSNEDLKNLEM